MIKKIRKLVGNSKFVTDYTVDADTPANGIVYFTVATDDAETNEFQYFQPQSSTILIKDGEMIEFSIRLGKWEPTDAQQDRVMENLTTVVRAAERNTRIYTDRIDTGGTGFVPHVHGWTGPYSIESFDAFLSHVVSETAFLQSHGTAP